LPEKNLKQGCLSYIAKKKLPRRHKPPRKFATAKSYGKLPKQPANQKAAIPLTLPGFFSRQLKSIANRLNTVNSSSPRQFDFKNKTACYFLLFNELWKYGENIARNAINRINDTDLQQITTDIIKSCQ